MSEGELLEIVRAGLSWAVTGLVPIVLSCCAAAAVFGLIAYRVGLSDGVLPIVVRAVAVVVALYSVGGALVEEAVTMTEQAWGALAAAGRSR